MKCQLMVSGYRDRTLDPMRPATDCLKEECAWWVKASESCAMEAIPRIIGYVGSTIKELEDKMPHENQFKK